MYVIQLIFTLYIKSFCNGYFMSFSLQGSTSWTQRGSAVCWRRNTLFSYNVAINAFIAIGGIIGIFFPPAILTILNILAILAILAIVSVVTVIIVNVVRERLNRLKRFKNGEAVTMWSSLVYWLTAFVSMSFQCLGKWHVSFVRYVINVGVRPC